LHEGSALPTPIQSGAEELAPFLYVMRAAALAPLYGSSLTDGGKRYSLQTRRPASRPTEFHGEIHNHQGVKCVEFRAVYSDGSGVPRRMECRPKSFLRLVFEAEPPEERPAPVPSLFPQEAL
jgi:hypothetical protein